MVIKQLFVNNYKFLTGAVNRNRWLEACRVQAGKTKSERGFTLIELIVIMVIIGIFSSSLIMPYLSSVNRGSRPGIYVMATQLATADIEAQRALGYDDIQGDIDDGNYPIVANTSINGRNYTSTVTAQLVDADNDEDGNSFGGAVVNEDYILIDTTVTETTNTPNLTVSLSAVISRQDYDY